jgi:hypothetical protein
MSISSLRTGEKIAAAAAVLLFADMFLKWYGVDLGEALGAFVSGAGGSASANAWERFEFTDVLLFLIIVATLVLVALRAAGRGPALPVPRSTIIAVLGAIAALWILWRLINEPGPNGLVDVKVGGYLGLLFAAGIAFGGWRAMQEEGVTIQDARRQAERAVRGRDSAPPPPAAGP